MKYTWFLHHQPLSPVSSDDQGQGSRSACPSIGTHMGWQTVPGFVYLFFSSPLHFQSHLTFNDREQGVFVRHKPVWHHPEKQREFMAVFRAAARPWRWQNTCRDDMLMTAAQPRVRRGTGSDGRLKKKKKRRRGRRRSVSAWDTKSRNLNVFLISF